MGSIPYLQSNGSSQILDRICTTINQLIDGGGGSGGHAIVTPNSIIMPQRANLKFDSKAVTMSDDIPNDQTVVHITSPLYYDGDGSICINYDMLDTIGEQ